MLPVNQNLNLAEKYEAFHGYRTDMQISISDIDFP